MSQDMLKMIPLLIGSNNYQTWKHYLQLYLKTVDAWCLTNSLIPRPVVAAAAPTDAETEAMARWDSLNMRALSYISFMVHSDIHWSITHHMVGDVEYELTKASTVWTRAETLYGTVLPTRVYEDWKKALQFCLDPSKALHPQIVGLTEIYCHLNANNVPVPDFIRAMNSLYHYHPPGDLRSSSRSWPVVLSPALL
jgi:hypothetical protein